MRRPYPKSVAPASDLFDSCEPEFLPWIMGLLVASFLLNFKHCIFFQGMFGFVIILDKYACRKCKLSKFSDQIDA